MSKLNKQELKANLKEASDLLGCLKINDEKLQKIIAILSDKIKNDENIKKIVDSLGKSLHSKEDTQDFDSFFKTIEKQNLLPLIETVIMELGDNPEVIENIEKKVFPILFSK